MVRRDELVFNSVRFGKRLTFDSFTEARLTELFWLKAKSNK